MKQHVQQRYSPIFTEVYRGESEDKRRIAVIIVKNKKFKVNVFEDKEMKYLESKRVISSLERALQVAEAWINYQQVDFYDIYNDEEYLLN